MRASSRGERTDPPPVVMGGQSSVGGTALPPDEMSGGRRSAVDIARRLGTSERLRRRRFELLPLTGPGSCFTDTQGRGGGESTAPAALADLISSVSTVGFLQPLLVEELPDGGGLRLVAGERRLRAGRWGATAWPDHPHFRVIPAVVCPGPLTEEERRCWQLVENLARQDLEPGELAAALVYERCAVLASRLSDAGTDIPAEVWDHDDPLTRWAHLEKIRRSEAPHIGAAWPDVLRRLGIQMRHETAARLVRALKGLPPELASDMDANHIALATRISYLRLDNGRGDAAAGIWAAVKARRQPELLSGAVRCALDRPDVDADAAVDHAEAVREAGNQARRNAFAAGAAGDIGGGGIADVGGTADPAIVERALGGLRELVAHLAGGARPDRYAAGSLRLIAEQLVAHLEHA